MRVSSLLLSLALLAADAPTPKPLTPEQKAELSAVTLKALKAELEVRRLDDAYQQERAKRLTAANEASQAYAAVVKRLQALAPKGCTLTDDGDFKCQPDSSTKPKD